MTVKDKFGSNLPESIPGRLIVLIQCCLLVLACQERPQSVPQNSGLVAETRGLVAFWDFEQTQQGRWSSVQQPGLGVPSFPIALRKIGDPKGYSMADWPYRDSLSAISFDTTGPFGHAVKFNRGHIYGSVHRSLFDGTLLDVHGRMPFTMIAWVKFVGERHMVAGIWDEGGWDRYGGRRQVALFAGLFNQKGVIAHISATGAASFPQSTVDGSQYARLRAIDGQAFEDDTWVAMAMTFDPDRQEVRAYLNGQLTQLQLNDPVTESVYAHDEVQSANPFDFRLPIYSPQSFVLKFNGYQPREGVGEHRLLVDLDKRQLTYEQDAVSERDLPSFRVLFDIERAGRPLLDAPHQFAASNHGASVFPDIGSILVGDEIIARLEQRKDRSWQLVGTPVRIVIQEGAPFTFGRALGLGSDDPDHGSQLFVDGVAVFNRVLTPQELRQLSFCGD